MTIRMLSGNRNMLKDNIKVGKHVTCDVTFVTVRAQPYWKLYLYVIFFVLISLHD